MKPMTLRLVTGRHAGSVLVLFVVLGLLAACSSQHIKASQDAMLQLEQVRQAEQIVGVFV